MFVKFISVMAAYIVTTLVCLIVILMIMFWNTSCTLMRKDNSCNEMEEMTEQVLKAKTGIQIEFKPLPKDK